MRASSLLLLLACTKAPPASEGMPAGGWVEEVAADPEAFSAWLDRQGRQGWVELHRGRPERAMELLRGGAQGRARHEARAAAADLQRLTHALHTEAIERFARSGRRGADSGMGLIAALVALDQGREEEALRWLGSLPPQRDPELEALAIALRDHPHLDSGLFPNPPASGPRAIVARHILLRSGAPGETPDGWLSQAPLRLADPLLAGTLLLQLSGEGPAPSAREARLFSACWSAASAELDCLDGPPPGADPLVWDRELQSRLQSWRAQELPGMELVAELELVELYQSRVRIGQIRRLLSEGQPEAALRLATRALDLRAPRRTGPLQPAALLVLLAEARLRQGQLREALDALEPLRRDHPELWPLMETLADLAVLEGMTRQGDSRE